MTEMIGFARGRALPAVPALLVVAGCGGYRQNQDAAIDAALAESVVEPRAERAPTSGEAAARTAVPRRVLLGGHDGCGACVIGVSARG